MIELGNFRKLLACVFARSFLKFSRVVVHIQSSYTSYVPYHVAFIDVSLSNNSTKLFTCDNHARFISTNASIKLSNTGNLHRTSLYLTSSCLYRRTHGIAWISGSFNLWVSSRWMSASSLGVSTSTTRYPWIAAAFDRDDCRGRSNIRRSNHA